MNRALDMLDLPPRGCCSDLQLDQALLGELSPTQDQALRAHLAASPPCQARFQALQEGARGFQPRPLAPTAVVLPFRRRVAPMLAPVATLAAAATVLFMVQRTDDVKTPNNDTNGVVITVIKDGVRTKGDGFMLDVKQQGRSLFVDDDVNASSSLEVAVTNTGAALAGAHWFAVLTLSSEPQRTGWVVSTMQEASGPVTLSAPSSSGQFMVAAVGCAGPLSRAQAMSILQGQEAVPEACRLDRLWFQVP